jgi:ppGpp synthetase/RelA/SpoT-type nucleotidyltranferase
MSELEAIKAEVREFLSKRQPGYEGFLDDVQRDLLRFRDVGSNYEKIYRIYSRADKQRGQGKLKSVDGIANTLRRWREKNPAAQVREVHDIIGLTIVTYFKSDIEYILKRISSGDRFPHFKHKENWPKQEGGYDGHHVVVSSKGNVFTFLCEIQIKSMLNDGWSAKIHDLTYKPQVLIDQVIGQQVVQLGKSVQNLEAMSDDVHKLIYRRARIEAEKREAAVLTLLSHLSEQQDSDYDPAVAELAKTLIKFREHFAACAEQDRKLGRLVARWRKISAKSGPSRATCRFISLLAAIREDSDFDATAYEEINTWLSKSGGGQEHTRRLALKMMAQWALGDLDDAVATGDELLAYAEKNGLAVHGARINIAYYRAERAFATLAGCAAEELEVVERLAAGWDSTSDDRVRMSRQDSVGAIKIMIGKTDAEIRAGEDLCQQALEWAEGRKEDTEVFRAFHELHSQRAARRRSERDAQR